MLEKLFCFLLSIVALFSGFTVSENTDVIRYRNMPYGLRAKRQILDLNIPKSVKGDANMVLFIHGGGWTTGSKDDYEASIEEFSQMGYVSAALNYRYAGKPNYASAEDMMDDISAALKKIRDTAAENGIRLQGVLLDGGSAGAHLSLLYAYSKADEAPIRPIAVVAKCPPTDFTDMSFYDGSIRALDPEKWTLTDEEWYTILTRLTNERITGKNIRQKLSALSAISPIFYVTEKTVPTILAHGTMDTVVPYANSVALDAKLTACGVEHTFITFPGAWHDLQNCPEGQDALNRVYTQYIEKYLAIGE